MAAPSEASRGEEEPMATAVRKTPSTTQEVGGPMITATVRYKLPPHIDYASCRAHFHKIAPGFQQVKGLISKHFVWTESGWAGGVYQWETLEDARRFYGGSWPDATVPGYGMLPPLPFYKGFPLT